VKRAQSTVRKLSKRLDQLEPVKEEEAADLNMTCLKDLTRLQNEMAERVQEKTIPERRRVTLWDRSKQRKLAGMAAPLPANLERYLQLHPECEVYNGQEKQLALEIGQPQNALNQVQTPALGQGSQAPSLGQRPQARSLGQGSFASAFQSALPHTSDAGGLVGAGLSTSMNPLPFNGNREQPWATAAPARNREQPWETAALKGNLQQPWATAPPREQPWGIAPLKGNPEQLGDIIPAQILNTAHQSSCSHHAAPVGFTVGPNAGPQLVPGPQFQIHRDNNPDDFDEQWLADIMSKMPDEGLADLLDAFDDEVISGVCHRCVQRNT